MMKKTIGVLVFLCGVAVSAESKCGDDSLFNPLTNMEIKYHNVIAAETVKKGAVLTAEQNMGKIRSKPSPLTPDDNEFRQGEDAYGKGDYDAALASFLKVYRQDRLNPFVINAIARTFYKIDGQGNRSYNAYQDLMKVIEKGYWDSEKYSIVMSPIGRKGRKTVVIDPWFLEAYWKLGTLYMDREKYAEAILQMGKMYFFEFSAAKDIATEDRAMAVQLFSYLAEAHFFLKNKKANQYYICRTKEVDPANTYVDRFALK